MLVGKCSRANFFIIPNEHARSSENIVVRLRFLHLFETTSFALFASAASICFCSANGAVQCPANGHARRAIPVPTRPLFSRELPAPRHSSRLRYWRQDRRRRDRSRHWYLRRRCRWRRHGWSSRRYPCACAWACSVLALALALVSMDLAVSAQNQKILKTLENFYWLLVLARA